MFRFVLQENIRHLRRQLAGPLSDTKRAVIEHILADSVQALHDLEAASNHVPAPKNGELRFVAKRIIDEAMRLHGAQFGNLQLFDPRSRTLTIIEQRNFQKAFLDHFACVTADDGSACGRAMASGMRVIASDVARDPAFAEHMSVLREAGIAAVQSTPLLGAQGQLIAVLSTHFAHPRAFTPEEIEAMDRQAAGMARYLERSLDAAPVSGPTPSQPSPTLEARRSPRS